MKCLIVCSFLLALAACDDHKSNVMHEIEAAEQRDAQQSQAATADQQQFVDAAKARPGAQARASGLVVEFVHRGANQRLPHPSGTATVTVHYEGKLSNGHVFDSSFQRNEPAEFPLNGVVPGFSEAIQMMVPGDEVIATFPGAIGYGPDGDPQTGGQMIPPNAALQFRIQLIKFNEANGRVIQAPGR